MTDSSSGSRTDSDDTPRPAAPGGFFGRLVAAVQNGIEIARFGGLGEREPSPYVVMAEERHHRLRHYFPGASGSDRPAAILVPPLMLSAEVWDVAPDSSAVAALHDLGADPWVVDFGSPETEEGGLDRTLSDHVVAVSRAVDVVRAETGRDVHLMGYSQGGMFCYQAAAFRNVAFEESSGIASLVTFGSPVDMYAALPVDLPVDVLADILGSLGRLQSNLFPTGIPAWATRIGFQLLDPVKAVRQRIDFARQLYDREALQAREGIGRFLEREGWEAFPGPALKDFIEHLIASNRMLQGGFVVDERTATLASITCPILAFVGDTDSIAPAPGVQAIRVAAPEADSYEAHLPGGHFALVVGSRATGITWPTVAAWLDWQEGRGRCPENVTPVPLPSERVASEGGIMEQLGEGLGVALEVGRELFESASGLIGKPVDALDLMSGTIAPQLPRLVRLEELRRDTPVSMGLVLEERSQASPEGTLFLFEGRAHSYRDANERIDNVVLGLLECGVRQGQYVGLLMKTRPSAVVATLALSRLGAVAVMLRPDVSLAEQLEQVPVEHLVADPEHAEEAGEILGQGVLVLGGGGGPRTLAPGLIDMEAIDPDRVTPPAWYTPNPGLASELGLVLITGDEGRLAANRVTNRRFATSAYGTASACALTSRDTVYCSSPTHHPTGIMVCVGGALVSGARLAMATPGDLSLDPERFWQDVRRYGVSVVFYSWNLLRFILNAPDTPAEHHHPIRLFAGSGMPVGIWRRLKERFHPARVVEFYASTEGNAVLVNLTGRKIGSVGRSLPGAAELALAAYDLEVGELVEQESGFAERCEPGEVGLLLCGVDRTRGEVEGRPLRSVFESGDAWLSSGDLFRMDSDGDYWLVGAVADIIRTPHGALLAVPVEDVLSRELDFVDQVSLYGVALPGVEGEVPVAAITIRRGAKLDPVALRCKVEARLENHRRPRVVRVMDELPETAGYRIRKSVLRQEGLGLEEASGETLWLAPGEEGYVPLGRDEVEEWIGGY